MADRVERRKLEVVAPVLQADRQEKAGRSERRDSEGSERRRERDPGEERLVWRASAGWGTPKNRQEPSDEALDAWAGQKDDARLCIVPESCRFRVHRTVEAEPHPEAIAGKEHRAACEDENEEESGVWRGYSGEGGEAP